MRMSRPIKNREMNRYLDRYRSINEDPDDGRDRNARAAKPTNQVRAGASYI